MPRDSPCLGLHLCMELYSPMFNCGGVEDGSLLWLGLFDHHLGPSWTINLNAYKCPVQCGGLSVIRHFTWQLVPTRVLLSF
jgi:hypothetical protein